MKKHAIILTIAFLNAITNFAGTPELKHSANGIGFTENKGQIHDQNYKSRADVLYGLRAGNMVVHIKNNGLSYQLYRTDSWKERLEKNITIKEIDQQTIYRVDVLWLNHNLNFTKKEGESFEGFNNYYLESCPGGALNVKSYREITLQNLYNGIDLHYYEKNGELKHDYIVTPHSNYKQIQLRIKGADVSLDTDGSLKLTTPLGQIQEGAPLVYQNGRKLVAKWKISQDDQGAVVSFEIENYNSNYELVIDPVTRLWGTYYDGNDQSNGYCLSADSYANVFMAGTVGPSTGTTIATSGAHQQTYAGS